MGAVFHCAVDEVALFNVTNDSFDELPELEIQSNNVNSWQSFVSLNNAISSTAQWNTTPIPCDINIYSLQLKIIEQDTNRLSVYDLV